MILDVNEILSNLSVAEGLPRGPLEQAIARPEAVTPEFLGILERFVDDPEGRWADRDAVFFIVHLLAQFREKRAYPLLMRLLAWDPERLDEVLGDAITSTVPRLVVSLFDGDPAPIHRVIENPEADQYVRSGLFEALAYLVHIGKTDREETAKYLLDVYWSLQPQGSSFLWVGWQSAISMLGLVDFRSLVRKAFASGKIDPSIMGYEHFASDLHDTIVGLRDEARLCRDHGPFDDTIGEFSSWSFAQPESARDDDYLGRLLNSVATPMPAVNKFRDVGRNDPCPCGSGKKFKKCCLH
jgi:hypothetical protein